MKFTLLTLAVLATSTFAKPYVGEQTMAKRNPIQPVDPSPSCFCRVGDGQGSCGPNNSCQCNSNTLNPQGENCNLCSCGQNASKVPSK